MKAFKITGIALGSLVALVVIVAVAAWIMVSLPSGIGSRVTDVESSTAAAASLDAKWNDFASTVAASPPGTAVSVTLTQEELNSKINEELKTLELPDGLTVNDINVNVVDGELLLSADVKYSVLSGSAGLAAKVEIVNGSPEIVVTDVDMGKLPIPQTLKDQLKNLIPDEGLIQASGSSFDTSSVQLVNGQLVISGVTK